MLCNYYFAIGDFIVHLSAHMMYIIVNHWQSNAYRQNGYNRKYYGRIGYKAISLNPILQIDCHFFNGFAFKTNTDLKKFF